jgi:hypothetical protein
VVVFFSQDDVAYKINNQYGAIAKKHMADLLIARFPPQNPPHIMYRNIQEKSFFACSSSPGIPLFFLKPLYNVSPHYIASEK